MCKECREYQTKTMANLHLSEVDVTCITEEECCKKHKGEVLTYYCKTCRVLVCQKCTVVDKPESSHTYVNIKLAAKEQRIEIGQLMKDCENVKGTVEESLKTAEEVQNNLKRSLEKAKADLHQAAEAFRVQVLADIKQKEIELEASLVQVAAAKEKQIDAQKDKFQQQQQRLNTAIKMTTEVIERGSDYELALTYSPMKNNLTQFKNMRPENWKRALGEITFISNNSRLPVDLGSLSLDGKDYQVQVSCSVKESLVTGADGHSEISQTSKRRTKGVGTWKLVSKFGQQDPGKLLYARSIAMASSGDFIVADCNGKVNMYNHAGGFKFCLYIKQGLKFKQRSYPWNVVVSKDGRIFITQCVPHVNIYNTRGTYKYQFRAKSPSNVSSNAQDTELWGLALDNQQHLLVGEVNYKYISKHYLDGSHIRSIKVTIPPGFIAVASNDLIVVSHSTVTAIQVIDSSGIIVHTLNPPPGISKWWPYGLSCTAEDEVYVANYRSGNDGGIYCFALSGQYLGCITKAVEYPADFTLCDDENKLFVVENESVKIFCRQ